MSYVTREYYNDTFHGESVDSADFPSLLTRAEEIIEEMTLYRLSETTFAEPYVYCFRQDCCIEVEDYETDTEKIAYS